MRRPKDKLIAGLDLHSNNVMIGIINQDGKRVAHRKLDCDLKQVTEFLEPLKPQLQSMAVESTFNWYWLVDGLREGGVGVEALQRARPRSAADAEIERRAAVAAVRARGQRAANHSLLVVGPCATCCDGAPTWCISTRPCS